METLSKNPIPGSPPPKSLLLLEVELMETLSREALTLDTPRLIASIIGSGINGNDVLRLDVDFGIP